MTSTGDGRPNIVFIVSDTSRARNYSTYGYDRPTSPNLSRIANESTTYQNAIATAPWTLASHASMFTGAYTSDHGCNRSSPHIAEELSTLPELLSDRGYTTRCISSNALVTSNSSLNTGFEETYLTTRLFPNDTDYHRIKEAYRNEGRNAAIRDLIALVRKEGGMKDIGNICDKYLRKLLRTRYDTNRFVERKGSQANVGLFKKLFDPESGPQFFYLNFMETHLKYLPPSEQRSRFLPDSISTGQLRSLNQDPRLFNYAKAVSMTEEDFSILEDLYDGTVRYTDHLVGQIYDYLDAKGCLDDTLFIFVSDHGENIGDHGLMGHSLALNDALLRVPLVVSYPDQRSSEDIDGLVQIHDLYSTILDVCDFDGSDPNADLSIRSRVLPRTDDDSSREYAIAEYLGSPFSGLKRMMSEYPDVDYEQYDYEIKTIYDRDGTKYTIRSTGDERLNLADINGEDPYQSQDTDHRSKQLQQVLFDRVDQFGASVSSEPIADDVRETLKDLGYV